MKDLQHIVERCRQGDREAFGQLYTACREPLHALCLHYVADATVADDLLHDAFVIIISRIGELKEPNKAEAWMRTVTRNLALHYLRMQKQQNKVPLNEVIRESEEATVPEVTYDEIMGYVNALPEGYRQVFRLSVLEGMSHQQIAQLLHIEPHSSSSQLYRAKTVLRRVLRPLLLILLAVLLPLGIYYWPDGKPTGNEQTQNKPAQNNQTQDQQKNDEQQLVARNMPSADSQETLPLRHIPTTDIAMLDVTVPVAVQNDIAQIASTPDSTVAEPQQTDTPASEPWRPATPSATDIPTPSITHEPQPDDSNEWSIDMAYSGWSNHREGQLPYADENTNDAEEDSLTHHRMPLTVGLMLNKSLGRHWQVSMGVEYTRLTSDTQVGNTYTSFYQKQRVQYLGIPLSWSWKEPLSRQLTVYATGTLALHLPLHSTTESVWMLNGLPVDPTTTHLHPGVQWSVGLGLGIRYQLAPHISLFAEPRLHHYFNNGSGVETWNTAHPITFSLPFGLQITW
jgi:RNA polymerase sigma-70 factor (ECF subfamily)